jgi:hypothetical protein
MAKNKSNTQYFERALSKPLTKFGHTTLKEQQKSCIPKLVVDSQGPRCLCRSANWLRRKSYYQVLPALFSELYRLRHGTI